MHSGVAGSNHVHGLNVYHRFSVLSFEGRGITVG